MRARFSATEETQILNGTCVACPEAAPSGPYCPRCTGHMTEDMPAVLALDVADWERIKAGGR